MIKRKSAHKFRILTIEKYQKTLPQIKKIIKSITPDNPDYKDYMEDKVSLKKIKHTPLDTLKNSMVVYDLMRYIISKYSNLHKIDIPQDEERNMLIKLWDRRRAMGYKQIIGEIRQRVSMFGIFMGRWKLKEVMIKMENNKLKFNDELQITGEKLTEAKQKLEDGEKKLKKANTCIDDFEKRLKMLEEAEIKHSNPSPLTTFTPQKKT